MWFKSRSGGRPTADARADIMLRLGTGVMNVIVRMGRSENVVQGYHRYVMCSAAMTEDFPIGTCRSKGLLSPSSFEYAIGVSSPSK